MNPLLLMDLVLEICHDSNFRSDVRRMESWDGCQNSFTATQDGAQHHAGPKREKPLIVVRRLRRVVTP